MKLQQRTETQSQPEAQEKARFEAEWAQVLDAMKADVMAMAQKYVTDTEFRTFIHAVTIASIMNDLKAEP